MHTFCMLWVHAQTFRVGTSVSGTAAAPTPLGAAAAEPDTFEGFDGIGRSEEAYAPAEVLPPLCRAGVPQATVSCLTVQSVLCSAW